VGETAQEEAHPLDNAVWWSLDTRHRDLSRARGRARAYRSDTSVFSAVEAFEEAAWTDLSELLGPSRDSVLFCADTPSDLPEGWGTARRIACQQMVVEGDALTRMAPVATRRLTPADVPQMLDLVVRTEPGPFRPNTVAMGSYYGHFEGPDLVAMAGERLGFDGYTEISAVCTDPAMQGRGLGSALTYQVASEILARGEQPFLHVTDSNTGARRIYERLGFIPRRSVEAVLLQTPPG
jgi:GNAT superfamily N-acetyltransferase